MTSTYTRDQVLSDLLGLIDELSGDWESDVEFTEQTILLQEGGLESIDLVALGTGIEEKYGRSFPFARFVEEIGEEGAAELTLGQLVEFVLSDLRGASPATEASR